MKFKKKNWILFSFEEPPNEINLEANHYYSSVENENNDSEYAEIGGTEAKPPNWSLI